MKLATDILACHIRPRSVARRRLTRAAGEGAALGYLMSALAILFLARLPRVGEEAAAAAGSPHPAGIAAALLLGMGVLAPLCLYGLAALSAVLLKVARCPVTWSHARIALFWSLLAVAPAAVIRAGIEHLSDSGIHSILYLLVGALFAIFWVSGLIEAIRLGPDRRQTTD